MKMEVQAVVDELERLLKVEKEYRRYREKVEEIIRLKIESVKKGSGLYKPKSNSRVLGLLRSVKQRIEGIKV